MRPTFVVTRGVVNPPVLLEDLTDEEIGKEIAAGNFVIEISPTLVTVRVKFYEMDEDAVRRELKPTEKK